MELKTGLRGKLLAQSWAYELFKRVIASPVKRQQRIDKYINAQAGQKILDIGCGTADILNYLPAVHYTGYDANPKYIETARERYGAKGNFICALVESYSLVDSGTYDIVIANGVLHHLEDTSCIQLLETAKTALKKGGKFVSFDPVYLENQNPIARYLASKDRGQNVRYPEGYINLTKKVFAKSEIYITNDGLRLPYNHCVINAWKE